MYRFYVDDHANKYHYDELCRVFLPDNEFEIICIDKLPKQSLLGENSFVLGDFENADRDAIKRELYEKLSSLTEMKPEWGTLTGVRPLKPALAVLDKSESLDEMSEVLRQKYLLSDSKLGLLSDIAKYQRMFVKGNPSDMISIYAGIPFCPTRCEYCSFASNVADDKAIEEYLANLCKETEYCGKLYKNHPKEIESVYIGGGTPTTLSASQLKDLISRISDSFKINPADIEFTVEAGRPDTITEEKLKTIKNCGVSRISINPQSMKDETMRLIGRDHSAQDIRNAFAAARRVGFEVINADLIAGLPEETPEDFANSLDEIIRLGAENITVHTLSVKRGSRLHENDPEYYRRDIERVSKMLSYAGSRLKGSDYHPYYIYRQKHQMGAFENVGYCLEGKHSIYNIRIMEDKQSIIALGAGGVGKIYYPEEDRIERVANVSNYEIYNERFNEMLERKDKYFGG